MQYATSELTTFLEAGELKQMLSSAAGPCLSVYAPISKALSDQGQYALRWKECLKSLDKDVAKFDGKAEELRRSVADWQSIYDPKDAHGAAVAVFRSAEVFRRIWLDRPVEAQAFVGPNFNIRPLLPELARDRVFCILALSQKDVRLLRCTSSSAELVQFPAPTLTSFDAYLNPAKPDHVTDNRASPGPSSGSSKGVMFSTSTGREDKGEHLAHFFRQIDRGLNEVLREGHPPVVLAGVEYEVALYRASTTYGNVVDDAVEGAPNSLKGGELQARALAVMDKCYEQKIQKSLEAYEQHFGAGRATNSLKEVVAAAYDGRILTLLLSDSMQLPGRFEESTHEVKAKSNGLPDEEDLLNVAAVQCLLHSGQVLVAPNNKMPNGAPAAAVLRF